MSPITGKLREKLFRLAGRESAMAPAAIASIAVKVVGAAVSFVTSIVLARVMGAAEFGIYSYALTWLTLLVLFGRLGLDSAIMKFAAAYQARSEFASMRGILRSAFRWSALAALIFAVGLLVVVWVVNPAMSMGLKIALTLAACIVPLQTLSMLLQASLRVFRRPVMSFGPDLVVRPALIGLGVGALYLLVDFNVRGHHAMAVAGVATLVAVMILWLFAKRTAPSEVSSVAYSLEHSGEWIRTALPMLFISSMTMVNTRANIVLIGALQDSEQVGLYAAATRVAEVLIFALQAVNLTAAPRISALYARKEYSQLQGMLKIIIVIIAAVTIPATAILFFAGGWVMSFFGSEFVAAEGALRWLLIGQALNALAGPVGYVLTMTGHHKQAGVGFAAAAVVNIVLNLLLIPPWGIEGAAIATAISTAMWNIAALTYAINKIKLDPSILAWAPNRRRRGGD